MPTPVTVHRLSNGQWEVHCGGCLKFSESIVAASDVEAWPHFERQGWTAFQFNAGSRPYAKCPACSQAPSGEVPRRKHRHHR